MRILIVMLCIFCMILGACIPLAVIAWACWAKNRAERRWRE